MRARETRDDTESVVTLDNWGGALHSDNASLNGPTVARASGRDYHSQFLAEQNWRFIK